MKNHLLERYSLLSPSIFPWMNVFAIVQVMGKERGRGSDTKAVEDCYIGNWLNGLAAVLQLSSRMGDLDR